MTAIDPGHYATLTFDCYGTLIDWEGGITGYLQPLLERYDVHVIDEFVLEAFSRLEPELQAEGGAYTDVLARLLERLGERLAFAPKPEELAGFGASIAHWPAFDDTVAALETLATLRAGHRLEHRRSALRAVGEAPAGALRPCHHRRAGGRVQAGSEGV